MTTALFIGLLGATLLLDPEETPPESGESSAPGGVRAAPSEGARVPEAPRIRIRSASCDFDRKAGVVLFEGDASVVYEGDYTLNADRVFAFLTPSNRLSRIVADGNVVISNGLRTGTCALATYRQAKGEVEMFGDASGRPAALIERGTQMNELEGDRIRFWPDSEQVEVSNSRITAEHGGLERSGI